MKACQRDRAPIDGQRDSPTAHMNPAIAAVMHHVRGIATDVVAYSQTRADTTHCNCSLLIGGAPTMNDRPSTKARSFDLVSRVYPALEWLAFGNALENARGAFLSNIINAERLLLVGEGNGRFLARCLKEKANGSITVVDSSPQMLRSAEARAATISHQTRLRFVHGDIRALTERLGKFDVIVTHFFLDLFRPESQRRIVDEITDLADSTAVWVNVDYRPKLGSAFRRAIDWLQYRFDECFSGVEADRHYDPSGFVAEFGWVQVEELVFVNGAVRAQLLTPRILDADR
jgi:ubiquinone/menaquinone biosynthesis C-methylase UbiE